VFTGEISNNKRFTQWGKKPSPDIGNMASDHLGIGLLHTHDIPGIPPDQTKEVMGCGLGIAYESDVHKIQPEDFAIISTNRYCPWYLKTDFAIPKGLPPCPPGGCHCMWGWIHNERGGGQEMYFTGYRCNVTGETGTIPIPKPAVARKCPYDKNNCTVGAKQPHYWLMGERNNNHQGYSDAPFYNEAYGWKHGAQDDLWDIDLGTTWANDSNQAPIPDTYGKWDMPIIPRDPNAPVGKATGPGAVNSPDSNATPATPSDTPATPDASPEAGASSAAASPSAPAESPSAAPDVEAGTNKLKVEPIDDKAPPELAAGAPSVSSAGAGSSSAAAAPTAGAASPNTGVSDSTAPGTSNSTAAGTSNSTTPVGSGSSSPLPNSGSPKPKKCKRSRKRFGRRRL
jgi:hypothetical protein